MNRSSILFSNKFGYGCIGGKYFMYKSLIVVGHASLKTFVMWLYIDIYFCMSRPKAVSLSLWSMCHVVLLHNTHTVVLVNAAVQDCHLLCDKQAGKVSWA